MKGMELKQNDGQFSLYIGSRLVLEHSATKPCVQLGYGACTINMPHGMYHLHETKPTRWEQATEFHIRLTAEEALQIEFPGLLTLDIVEEDQMVRIQIGTQSQKPFNRLKLELPLPKDDLVFGCGEQFSHTDLRGKSLPLWVSEPGIGRGPGLERLLANLHSGRGGSREHTYFPQGSFVTSKGFWCALQSTAYSRFDFSKPGMCQITVHEIPSTIVIGSATDHSTAAANLSTHLGRQKKLPGWLYDGLVLGVQGGREVVRQKINTAVDAGIPVAAVWCQDWQGIRMTPYGKQLFWNWEYDPKLYMDLPAFISELHDQHIRFMGYNNPFLSTDAPLYAEGLREGYFVKDSLRKTPYITSTSTFPVSLVDFCNPQACRWYKDIIRTNMIDIGMDGWMADFGEYLPPDGTLHQNQNPYLEHNRYPIRWAAVNAEVVQEAGFEQDIAFFCRSGFTGSASLVPLFWAGDQAVNFHRNSGIASVIPAGISSSLSGIGYWHFDIGGFFSFAWIKRSRELLMRSCDLAAFTQVMRTHEGINPVVNAQFDTDAEMLAHFARMVRVHTAMKPYHIHVGTQYHMVGRPPIQPVIISDKGKSRIVHDEYLYGEDLLVAPIIQNHIRSRKVELPEGEWMDFWTGRKMTGGKHRVQAPIGRPPVFIRAQSEYCNMFQRIAQKEIG